MEDIEATHHFEDSESSEDSSVSFFNKRNVLVALGTLIISAGVLFAYSRGFFSSTSTAVIREPRGTGGSPNLPDIIHEPEIKFFKKDKIIFSVDVKDNDLQASIIFNRGSFRLTSQLFNDDEYVYFQRAGVNWSIHKVKKADGSSENIMENTRLVLGIFLDKSQPRGIYYQKRKESSLELSFYNFETKLSQVMHPLKCPGGKNDEPRILYKSYNGSKLFYTCSSTSSIFSRNEPYNESSEKEIFGIESSEKSIISPDDKYMIIYGPNADSIRMINLEEEPIAPRDILVGDLFKSILTVFFSNDGKSLYIIKTTPQNNDGVQLFEVDFEELKQERADYSGQSAISLIKNRGIITMPTPSQN